MGRIAAFFSKENVIYIILAALIWLVLMFIMMSGSNLEDTDLIDYSAFSAVVLEAMLAILADDDYNLAYAVTATQKVMLKTFDMTAENVHKEAQKISADMTGINWKQPVCIMIGEKMKRREHR